VYCIKKVTRLSLSFKIYYSLRLFFCNSPDHVTRTALLYLDKLT